MTTFLPVPEHASPEVRALIESSDAIMVAFTEDPAFGSAIFDRLAVVAFLDPADGHLADLDAVAYDDTASDPDPVRFEEARLAPLYKRLWQVDRQVHHEPALIVLFQYVAALNRAEFRQLRGDAAAPLTDPALTWAAMARMIHPQG